MGDLGICFAVGLSCFLLGLCCTCYSRTVTGFGTRLRSKLSGRLIHLVLERLGGKEKLLKSIVSKELAAGSILAIFIHDFVQAVTNRSLRQDFFGLLLGSPAIILR